ncbi:MAG: hypothetical protein AAFU73_07880 [Planctomycetota bacterium]
MNSTRSTSNHPAAQGPAPSHRGLRRTDWAILLVYGTFLAGALVTGALWTPAGRAEFLDVALTGPVMPVYYAWLCGAAALGGETSGALMKDLGVAAIAAGHLGLVGLGRLCAGARPPARYVLAAFLALFVLAEGVFVGVAIQSTLEKRIDLDVDAEEPARELLEKLRAHRENARGDGSPR